MVIDPLQELMLALEVVFDGVDLDPDPDQIGVEVFSETFMVYTWGRLRPELQEALFKAYAAYTMILEGEEEDGEKEV